MSPWWLRPPADESESTPRHESDKQERPDPKRKNAPSDGTAAPATPAKVESRPTNPVERSRPPRRRRRPARQGDRRPTSTSKPKSMARSQPREEERHIALFCDLESIALANRESTDSEKFDIKRVLERLLDKGKVVVRKAYADWDRHRDFKQAFHGTGFELIDLPQELFAGKNVADIKMAVDAMEKCYSKQHLDTFVILSGAGEFSPLAAKLKENNKKVIGIGVKAASAKLLIESCDEFLFYEDICSAPEVASPSDGLDSQQTEAFNLMGDAIRALQRENKDVLWGSMIKQTMKRKLPSFSEGHYGYAAFSELLEDAERRNIIQLERDERSGSYIVTGFSGS